MGFYCFTESLHIHNLRDILASPTLPARRAWPHSTCLYRDQAWKFFLQRQRRQYTATRGALLYIEVVPALPKHLFRLQQNSFGVPSEQPLHGSFSALIFLSSICRSFTFFAYCTTHSSSSGNPYFGFSFTSLKHSYGFPAVNVWLPETVLLSWSSEKKLKI